MRNFNYTARDKSGAMKRGSVQSADRNAALHELTVQGLVPLSVTEGMLKTSSSISVKPVYVISVVIALLVIGLAVKFFILDKAQVKVSANKQSKNTQVATSALKPDKKNLTSSNKEKIAKKQQQEADFQSKAITKEIEHSKASFNPSTQRVEVVEDTKPSGFTTEGDQVLALATAVPLGEPLPPLPISPDLDKQIDKSLKTSIIVYDDDDDKVFNQKATVAKIKEELAKLISEGHSASNLVTQMTQSHNEVALIRSEAQAFAERLYSEGRFEEAQSFVNDTNKEFSEASVQEIKLPGWKRREMGR
jgi:cell division protein FtsI/penicillin-binding protein 2